MKTVLTIGIATRRGSFVVEEYDKRTMRSNDNGSKDPVKTREAK